MNKSDFKTGDETSYQTDDYQDHYYFTFFKSCGTLFFDIDINSGEQRGYIETVLSLNFFIPFVEQKNPLESHLCLSVRLKLQKYIGDSFPKTVISPAYISIDNKNNKDINDENNLVLNNNKFDKLHINDGIFKKFVQNMSEKHADLFFESFFPNDEFEVIFKENNKTSREKIKLKPKQKLFIVTQYKEKLQELFQSLDNKEMSSQTIPKFSQFIDLLKKQESRASYNNLSLLLEDRPQIAKKKI